MKRSVVFLVLFSSTASFCNADSLLGGLVSGVAKTAVEQLTGDSSSSKSTSKKGTNKNSSTTSTVAVKNLKTSTSASNGCANGVSSTFESGNNTVYASFNYEGVSNSETFDAIWYLSSNGVYTQVYNSSMTLTGAQNWSEFHRTADWIVGNYKVDVIVKSKVVATTTFSVTTPIKAALINTVNNTVNNSTSSGTSSAASASSAGSAAATPAATTVTKPVTSGGDDFNF